MTVAVAAVVAVTGSLASTVSFASAEHPEERLSTAVGALSGPTYDAIAAGVGAATGVDGSYVVRWSDAADIGSPGYGLLDELERRGLDVAADDYFRFRVTEHRTRQRAGADAQIHLATGGYVDQWRAEPDAVEVATYDPRTPEQLAEYAEVERASPSGCAARASTTSCRSSTPTCSACRPMSASRRPTWPTSVS